MLSRLLHTLRLTSQPDYCEPDTVSAQAALQKPLLENFAWPAAQQAQGSAGNSPCSSLNMSEIWFSGAPQAAHCAVTVAPKCPKSTQREWPQRRWPWSRAAAPGAQPQAQAQPHKPNNNLPDAGLFTLLDADLEAGTQLAFPAAAMLLNAEFEAGAALNAGPEARTSRNAGLEDKGLLDADHEAGVPLLDPALAQASLLTSTLPSRLPPVRCTSFGCPTPGKVPLAPLCHHASLPRSVCATEAAQLRPLQRPREIVGAFCGGLIGVVFGLQYTGHPSPQLQGPTLGAPWRMFVYPPFYGLVTAVSIMALVQWLSGDWQHPSNTLFLLTSNRVESVQTPSLARKLRYRELAGAALGAALGLVCGMQYAYEHGGAWRYYIFPQWLALNMILPSLAMTRWLVMPPVHDALRQAPELRADTKAASLNKTSSLRGYGLEAA